MKTKMYNRILRKLWMNFQEKTLKQSSWAVHATVLQRYRWKELINKTTEENCWHRNIEDAMFTPSLTCYMNLRQALNPSKAQSHFLYFQTIPTRRPRLCFVNDALCAWCSRELGLAHRKGSTAMSLQMRGAQSPVRDKTTTHGRICENHQRWSYLQKQSAY